AKSSKSSGRAVALRAMIPATVDEAKPWPHAPRAPHSRHKKKARRMPGLSFRLGLIARGYLLTAMKAMISA
ncbi:MAG: hypothetical protein LC732_12120, partial [Acidobacteria bacterium]|nr:hypothetical protein [Acidobacteriota bacterium]